MTSLTIGVTWVARDSDFGNPTGGMMVKRQPQQSSSKNGQYWRIEGFDGTRPIYRRDLLAHHLGTNQVGPLLQALAARAGLAFDEIVGAYASRRAPIRNELLEVTRDPQLRLSCGTNPFFTAVLVRRQENAPIKPPNLALQPAAPPKVRCRG